MVNEFKTENQIKEDFYKYLEVHTLTKKEINKYARSVQFFIPESRVKRAFERAYKELYRTLIYVGKNKKPK